MAYNPTTWIDGRTPVNALNLNKNERGIEQQGLDVEVLSEYVGQMDNRITNDVNVLSEYVNSMDTRVTEDIRSISDFVADLDTRVTDDIGSIEGSITALGGRVDGIDGDISQLSDSVADLDTRITDLSDIDSIEVSYSTTADPNITSVKDALDKLLYTNLSIILNSDSNTVLEKGSIINNINFTWNYSKNIISQIFDGVTLDNAIRNYSYTTPLNNNKTFILTANDGKNNASKSVSYVFVYPIYIGSLSANIVNPTQDDIKAMEKRVVNPSSQTITYNIDNKRMCIAVPSNWIISNIRDVNNFNITSSFAVSNLRITGLDDTEQDYKIYISEPTSQSSFSVNFNI